MAREMGILADVQSAEILYRHENCTIAWDATELSGAHVNEVHIAASADEGGRQYLTLGVAELPGGTTSDYSSHIVQCMSDLSETYAEFTESSAPVVLQKMQQNITSSMSDRVAVNHCVAEQLKNLLAVNQNFLEVNCNIHPLDSLSSSARTVLKETGIKSSTWGRDCAAANLLQGLSKLRYKQGKGDPVQFKAFMKEKQIPLKMFPRYVGNRMHIVFHLAGVTVLLKNELIEFVTKYCASRGGLTASISKDLHTSEILEHLQILGLLGKIITGPWMKLLYVETSSNLDVTEDLKKCVSGLENLAEEPSTLLTRTNDLFGNLLPSDPVLDALKAAGTPKEETIKAVATAMLQVCNRQLVKYLTVDFTDAEKKLAENAPVHNMHAERIIAITDSQTKRAPNAKMDFIESKVKFKSNKALGWLQDKTSPQKDKLIKFAIGKRREVTNMKKRRREEVQEETIKRMKQKARKRDDASRRVVEKQVKALDCLGKEVTADSEILGKVFTDNEVNEDVQSKILRLFHNPSAFVESKFCHTWSDKLTNQDTTYVICSTCPQTEEEEGLHICNILQGAR